MRTVSVRAGALAGRRGDDRDEIALAREPAFARGLRPRARESVVAGDRRRHQRSHAPHQAQPAEHVGLRRRCRRSAPTAGTRRRGARSCRSASGTRSRRRRGLPRPAPPRARPPTRPGRRRARRPRPAECVRVRGHASAASATSLIVRTVSAGYSPTAVSSDSMSASVPSSTALATSFTSARVGNGERVIDSSICVAVITGLPGHVAEPDDLLLDQRHAPGRNLDAEVAARDHHRVGGADDAGRGGRARPRSRSSRRAAAGARASAAGRARLRCLRAGARTTSPMKSALIAIAIRSATASVSVNGSTCASARGTCMPLRERSTPPRTTSHTHVAVDDPLDAQHDRAVGEVDVVAGPDPARELGQRRRDAVRVADDRAPTSA